MQNLKMMALALALAAFCAPAFQGASKASPILGGGSTGTWTESHYHKIRLLDGGPVQGQVDGSRWVGVEIQLAPKWKTYWLNPGDSGGVPPLFSIAGSKNLLGIQVEMPSPRRIIDKYGEAIGYKNSVVFPLKLTPRNGNQPLELKLFAQYGVCLDICIPAEAKLTAKLALNRSAPPQQMQLVQAALATVPPPEVLPVGEAPASPAVSQVLYQSDTKSEKLIVQAKFASESEHNDVFTRVEGDSYLPMARLVSSKVSGDEVVKTFEIDLTKGDDLKYLKGRLVTFTVIGAERSQNLYWRFPK